MLTIIHTWTCCQCGQVKSQRIMYRARTDSVVDFLLPPNWAWIDDTFVICDQHILAIKDKPKDAHGNDPSLDRDGPHAGAAVCGTQEQHPAPGVAAGGVHGELDGRSGLAPADDARPQPQG